MLCLCLQVGDEESREQLIKTHYMVRVGELTTQLQISDSKAVHFHSEVRETLTLLLMSISAHIFFTNKYGNSYIIKSALKQKSQAIFY